MIILPLLVVGSLSLIYLKGISQRLTIVQLESSLQQLASDTVSRLNNASSNASVLSASEMFETHLSHDPAAIDELAITEKLEAIAKGFPDYAEIVVFSQQGALITSVSEVFDGAGHQQKVIKHMIDARLDHHEAVWMPEPDGAIYYLVAHAVKRKHKNDQFIKNRVDTVGFLFISVGMGFLNELMSEGVEKQGIEYFLTDKDGAILFSPSTSLMASEYMEVDENVSQKLPQQLQQVILSRSSAINQYDADSESFYGGYKRLTQNLYLLGIITIQDLNKASDSMKQYVFWFVIFVFLSTAALLNAQINILLVNPINMLRRLVIRFKKGEYEQDISMLGSDELTLLASDFQELSHGLAKSSETVKNLAYYDALTGLPNRITFNVNLKKALKHCERGSAVMGLLFIDLDNFKYVNDVHGHQVGDELLQETAVRLESCLRSVDIVSRKVESGSEWSNDLVVRLGGDEFTIILTDIEQAHQASMVAQRIVEMLSQPFELAGTEINIGASIGIAMYPVDGTSADSLIKSADLAMYEAKQRGRNNYQFFTKALNEAVAMRLEIESSLRTAIKNEEFFLNYQPKIRLKDGEVVGVEALLRWHHPVKGVLLPANFITVAEDTGLIIDIGRIVLQLACTQLRRWHDEGFGYLKIAINLSALQLMHGSVVDDINDALKAHQVSPENLEVEITESVLMADERNCVEILKQFKALGVDVALDDFGTGYSSLAYIRKFPIDIIKIDRSFIIDIEENEESRAIIIAILGLAKALSLKVVIEGVETFDQLDTVSHMSCDYVQGFYFSKPVQANEIVFSFAMPSSGGHS